MSDRILLTFEHIISIVLSHFSVDIFYDKSIAELQTTIESDIYYLGPISLTFDKKIGYTNLNH